MIWQAIAGGPLAHESSVTVIPFFVPMLIVVAVIGVVMWRDRRRHPADDAEGTGAEPGPPHDV